MLQDLAVVQERQVLAVTQDPQELQEPKETNLHLDHKELRVPKDLRVLKVLEVVSDLKVLKDLKVHRVQKGVLD